jgi:uncharacterized protein (DUF1778 family)
MTTRSTTTLPIRTSRLDLHLSPEAKQTLNAAARKARCSVSQFVLTSALERAAEILTDRHRFELNAEQWEEFMTALDAPPRVVSRLQRLFRDPSPFDAPKTLDSEAEITLLDLRGAVKGGGAGGFAKERVCAKEAVAKRVTEEIQ